MTSMIWFMVVVFILLLIPTGSVLAGYIDPGSGSFFMQVLAASILGLLFILKGYWGRIKSYFSRSSKTSRSTNGDHQINPLNRDSSDESVSQDP